MGLNVSFEAFDGAYSAFNSFRKCLAWSIGGSYPPHFIENDDGWIMDKHDLPKTNQELDDSRWYFDDEITSQKKNPALFELLNHSDCDGYINYSVCRKLSTELIELLPKIQEYENKFGCFGHISRDGGYVLVTQRFIDGCNKAVENKKRLEFY